VKKLPEGFSDTVDSMSDEELNVKILEAEGNIYKTDDDLATNEKILDMKRELKEATSPYRDLKKQEQAKITYILFLKESRGMEIGNEE
jgi:hypothetical protein